MSPEDIHQPNEPNRFETTSLLSKEDLVSLPVDSSLPTERQLATAGQMDSVLRSLQKMEGHLDAVKDNLQEMCNAAKQPQPTSFQTIDMLLPQILNVSRETLAKVGESAKTTGNSTEPLLRDLIELSDVISQLLQAQEQANLRVVHSSLMKVLARYGVEFYSPTLGDNFNSKTEEVVHTIPAETKEEEGRIMQVFRAGCKINEKRLRYPQVIVSRYMIQPTENLTRSDNNGL